MDSHQSQVNVIQARIEQYRTSDIFSPVQKEKRIREAEAELEKVYLRMAVDIDSAARETNPQLITENSDSK